MINYNIYNNKIKAISLKTYAIGLAGVLVFLTSSKKEATVQTYTDQLNSINGTTEVNGQTFSTDSLSGKMLVVSFWASYDAQSRINSYQLLKLTDKYADKQFHNGKGIDVVSISLDKYKAPLRKAIATDGTQAFHHICDYRGTDSEWATIFEVYRPVNLLIDANGTVVARDFNVETLDNTLAVLSSEN